MIKEYKTISEAAGPLMIVKGVEGVSYDEMGEIEYDVQCIKRKSKV